ncbi:MAG: ral stress protein [Planctomycetota bacterium]|jgi:lipopolysaccharide biosynthesis glycosyltransferase
MPLAVTIRSALRALGPQVRLTLHVVDAGITPTDRARLLESWHDERLTVRWLTTDRRWLRSLPASGHIRPAAYARLFAPRLLPSDLDKVIYLDSDLLVLADLASLWAEPLADAACLAVPDVSCPWVDCAVALPNYDRCSPYLGVHPAIPNYREFGMSPHDPYLNSGVLVMDLERWRTDDITRIALEILDRHRRHVLWADQYALNVALHRRWRPLALAWNQGAHISRYPGWQDSPFDLETLAACRFEPRIVHFTTESKPWLYGNTHPFRPQFFDVLDETAWRGWRPRVPLLRRLWTAAGSV